MNNLNQGKSMGDVRIKEINLREYYLLFKKRLWIIVVITALTTMAGYYYSDANYTPLYETSTRIILGPDSDMGTLMVMIKDPIIMEEVKNELKLEKSPQGIASQITVTRIEDSQVIKISVTDTDPTVAANIANATAKTFKSEIVTLLDFNDVQLLSEAAINESPINESQNRLVIIGFIFGIITSIGFIFLLDSLDGSVKKESEIEDVLGVPVLGVVSNMNRSKLTFKKVKQQESVEIRGESIGVE